MFNRLSRVLLALLLMAGRESLGAQAEPPAAPADEAPKAEWTEPAAAPSQFPSRPVRSRPDKATPPDPAKASRYLALRAVSLVEGEAKIQTTDGLRTLRPGDLLGRDVVHAVDTGVLVLERKAAPGAAGGDARVVIRFDGQGKPTVRIYHVEDPTRVEPRPTK
jgi:hypothetical protein